MTLPEVIIHPLVLAGSRAVAWDAANESPLPFTVAEVEDHKVVREAHRKLSVASDEATIAVLRRRGVTLSLGTPMAVGRIEFLRRAHAWGRASVGVMRVHGDLLPDLRIGSWNGASGLISPAHAAFWSGVYRAASRDEWRTLTGRYSVLLYHRLAGEGKPEQVRIDVAPEIFARQIRVLRRIGFSFLTADDLRVFHEEKRHLPSRRATVVSVDDATTDVVEPLVKASIPAQLFVVTRAGTEAAWLDGTPLADWNDLCRLVALGVELGAHTRTHPVDLTALDSTQLESEIDGSRLDLTERLGKSPAMFAYPHGRLDERVRRRVVGAGFSLAYTTAAGLNRASSDRYTLRRVTVKAWDSRLSLIWKATTGQPVPRAWERWLLLRSGVMRSLSHTVSSALTVMRGPRDGTLDV